MEFIHDTNLHGYKNLFWDTKICFGNVLSYSNFLFGNNEIPYQAWRNI